MSTRVSRTGARGFTLAEVLIALAVLGVAGITATSLLAHLTTASVDGHTDVRRHVAATAVMESLLAHEYDELATGSSSGTREGGEDWTATVSDEATDLKRLRVDVTSDGRTVTLETLVSDRF